MTPRALFHPARLARRPVLSTQSDDRLVDLVRAGSEPAFETIVERYRRALMRYVSRLLPPERAEDVVQQSFVNAFEAMHRDGAALELRPWLYRIAHNTALNALRDRGLRHDELDELDESVDGVERPDQALERTQGLREVLVAVQALPERQRDAILLRELEGRSYAEIALALGVSDGAVRQLLNRARNSLRSAAAAVTPMPLITRLAASDSADPAAARVADLVGVGAAGSGALVAKVCATALVTTAVVGGVAAVPNRGEDDERGPAVGAEPARAAENGAGDSDDGAAALTGDARDDDAGAARHGDDGARRELGGRAALPDDERSGRRDGGHGGNGDDDSGSGGRSGPGGDDDAALREDDHSGPGGEGELVDDHSGPGSGPGDREPEVEEALSRDNSGPGGGGSGGDGGGSGSDDTPDPLDAEEPDSSGSGSGSGSG